MISVGVDDKEVALPLVKDRGRNLKRLSERLRDDVEVVMAAIKNNPLALESASDRMRGNKAVVIEAVRGNGLALSDASERLRNDKEVVLAAIGQHEIAFLYVGESLVGDKEVVLAVVEKNVHMLSHASAEVKEMCAGKDAVSILRDAIMAEKALGQRKRVGEALGVVKVVGDKPSGIKV